MKQKTLWIPAAACLCLSGCAGEQGYTIKPPNGPTINLPACKQLVRTQGPHGKGDISIPLAAGQSVKLSAEGGDQVLAQAYQSVLIMDEAYTVLCERAPLYIAAGQLPQYLQYMQNIDNRVLSIAQAVAEHDDAELSRIIKENDKAQKVASSSKPSTGSKVKTAAANKKKISLALGAGHGGAEQLPPETDAIGLDEQTAIQIGKLAPPKVFQR